jgi:hypothetical protein
MAAERTKFTTLALRLAEDDRLVKIKSMKEWAKLGATRRTREKMAKKLRGK